MSLDAKISEAAAPFAREVVRSVALSALLSMDFAPTSRPPPIDELVANELPRVLAAPIRTVQGLRTALGAYVVELEAPPWDVDAGAMLRGYLAKIETDPRLLQRATAFVAANGHRDFVFEVLKRSHKPATASTRRIDRITKAVGDELRVQVVARDVELAYAAAHAEIVAL